MKSVDAIKKDIDFCLVEIHELSILETNKTLKELKNKLKFLRTALSYIESGPNEHFVHSEKVNLLNLVEKINGRFSEWRRNNNIYHSKNQLKIYRKEMGHINIQEQIKLLEYITK